MVATRGLREFKRAQQTCRGLFGRRAGGRMLAPIITDPIFYALAIPAVIFLGLAKGGFSGVATGATPLLALYLPPLEAAALLLPIVLCQDAISVRAYWREWSSWNLKILLPGAVFGLVLGYLFAAHVAERFEIYNAPPRSSPPPRKVVCWLWPVWFS